MRFEKFGFSYSLVLAISVAGLAVSPSEANPGADDSKTLSESRNVVSARPGLALLASSSAAGMDTAKMEQLLQSYAANKQFMGAVIVAKDKQIILDKGYGFANLEWDMPNSPDTKFRLASISKQFTAASILLLEDGGKLKLDDQIKKYISDAPASWDKITISNLLTHSSGIPTYDKFPDYDSFKKSSSTSKDLLKRIRNKPLEFQPGEKFSYSNSGYLALGILIERVSGKSYGQFVSDNIFKPLGMKNSGCGSVSAIIKHRASGYVTTANGLQNAEFNDWSNSFSAGGLYSTVEDMLRWEQGLFDGKLLSKASLAKMTTPFKNGYGLGLDLRDENGHKVIGHTGSIDGFDNVAAYYPEDKLTVVILSNKSGPVPAEIAAKLAAICHGEKVVLPLERR